MSDLPSREDATLISYAIGTEVDAVATYRYLLTHLNPKYRKAIKHILDEEKEHIEELTKLLNGRSDTESV